MSVLATETRQVIIEIDEDKIPADFIKECRGCFCAQKPIVYKNKSYLVVSFNVNYPPPAYEITLREK